MENPMTHDQIEELWTSVSNYLPERVKLDCAVDYVKTLLDMDIDTRVLKAAGEHDDKLEQAVKIVLEDEGLEEDEEESYYDEQ
jgi:hypothetical protein